MYLLSKYSCCINKTHGYFKLLYGLSLKSHLELVKGQLAQCYHEQYMHNTPPPTLQQPVALPSTSSTSHQKVDFTAQYKQQPRATLNKLEEFFSLPQEDFKTCDPLQWWPGVVHSPLTCLISPVILCQVCFKCL